LAALIVPDDDMSLVSMLVSDAIVSINWFANAFQNHAVVGIVVAVWSRAPDANVGLWMQM
jgi:hypothetical protein